MKKGICLLIILAACILLQAACPSVHAEDRERNLTLLVYMTGSDLESRAGSASADLEEMKAAMPENESMAVLVFTGGSSAWKNEIPADRNCTWQVKPGELLLIGEDEQQNMGDAETLSGFLRQGVSLFPAEHYALILWDHGGGPLAGVCFDERYGNDGLTLEELTEALRNSPFAEKPLSLIGFDACLMASVETAYAMAPYAEYMAASEEPEPGEGWDYSFLRELGAAADGAEAGEMIIRTYAASQKDSLSPITLSCLDLSQTEELCGEIDRIFTGLAEEMTEDNYPMFAQCRVKSKPLGSATPMDWDLVDLIDLAKRLEKLEAADTAAVQEKAGKMIVSSYSSEKRENGLSVYAPFRNKQRFSQPWSDRYEKMGFSEGYAQYIRQFARIWLSSERIDWQDKAAVETVREENSVSLYLPLDDEQVRETDYARLLILETGFGAENECRLIYASDKLEPGNGLISVTYSGEALYLMNDKDELVDGPVELRPIDRGVAVPGILEDASWKQESVYLIWQDNGKGSYELSEIETYNDEMKMFVHSTRMPQKGDTFMLGGWTRRLPETDDIYKNWPYGDNILYCLAPYSEGTQWKLQFLPLYSEFDRIALFEIVDLQNNIHLSDPIPLTNPEKTMLSPEEQTAEDNGLKVTLKNATIMTGSYPAVQCELELYNGRQNTDRVYLQSVMLDQTVLANTRKKLSWQEAGITDEIGPGESRTAYVTISAQDLQNARVRKIHSLGFAFTAGDDIAAVSFDFPVDTGMIALEEKEETEILFSAEQDGISYEIRNLGQDEYGDLTGEMHLANHSGQRAVFTDTMTARVNGEELIGTLEKSAMQYIVLPDGYEARTEFRIDTQTYEDGERKELTSIEPSQVKQIRLELRRYGERQTVAVEFQPR